MPNVGQLAEFLERFAPVSLAESWDNVGLLVGDRNAPVSRLMTCLTVTPSTAREAIERGARMIVTHHPVLFRPVQKLTADDPAGRIMLDLIRAGISIYSPHTAFDGTVGGINEMICARLGLTATVPLRPAEEPRRCKIAVFVPPSDLEHVSQAMFQAGAGVIGEYRECSFRVAGRGTFFGSEQSHPAVGERGRRQEVEEWRLEVICPDSALSDVVRALRSAHSYEEPAYDVYPLAPASAASGAGRVGDLALPDSLGGFAHRVQAALDSPLVQVVGPPDRQVARIAIACGSGSEFLAGAARTGCDALVTGEASYHRLLEAEALEIGLILAGHHATERLGVESLAEKLRTGFPGLEVWASAEEHEPAWPLPVR